MREYAFAYAHERARNAWMRPSAQRRQAYAVARAQCELLAAADAHDPKTLRTAAEVALLAEDGPIEGEWEWAF